MEPLYHYIVVRRDLPLGHLVAQVAHAAGESFFAFPRSSVKERRASEQDVLRVGGSSPSGGANALDFDPQRTVVVVLGARSAGKLARLERQLQTRGVAHVAIREPDPPYCHELTAIGLVPGPKAALAPAVREFHMLSFTSD